MVRVIYFRIGFALIILGGILMNMGGPDDKIIFLNGSLFAVGGIIICALAHLKDEP